MARNGVSDIYDFGEAWKGTNNFRVTAVGNYIFSADVTYDSPFRGTQVESCTVQIFRNGMEDGNIEILAEGKLDNDTHHLGFAARWQTYEFDRSNNALVVRGNSKKMGGDYSVTLSPNGKKTGLE